MLVSTLDDMAHTAAWWWVKRMRIAGEKYTSRRDANDVDIEAFRIQLADQIRARMELERDGHVWFIGNHDETYPLLSRLASENNIHMAEWSPSLAMWISYRDDVAKVVVRTRKHPYNACIYLKRIDVTVLA